jgi:hypothetical protein
MARLIGNFVILTAGAFLMLGAAIAISIVFAYAFAVVLLRRLFTRPRPALSAGA